jgi:hypothetical protein
MQPLDPVAELVQVEPREDEWEKHREDALLPLGVEHRLVGRGVDRPETVEAAQVMHAVH